MYNGAKVLFAVCVISILGGADVKSQEVPLSDGAYISKEHCELAAQDELDMVGFMIEEGGRVVSHEESYCMVSRVRKLGSKRFIVDSDCKEFDDIFQNSFFLDIISPEHIRVDGEDLWMCKKGFLAKYASTTSSEQKVESVDRLIEAWADADENCAGGFGDDPATQKACDQRSKLSGQLGKQGMCLGKNGQSRSEYEWHKCTKNSVR